MKISVIIPTIGRESLGACIRSASAAGLASTDEIIVVSDGNIGIDLEYNCDDLEHETGLSIYIIKGPLSRSFGTIQRDIGTLYATGDVMMFMDDDDQYCDNAFCIVREAVKEHPGKLLIFRAPHQLFPHLVWKEKELYSGNLMSQLICVPREMNALASWRQGNGFYDSDYRYVQRLVDAGAEIEWIDKVILEKVVPNYGKNIEGEK